MGRLDGRSTKLALSARAAWLVVSLCPLAVDAQADGSAASPRQRAFAVAAAAYSVPESVLLAVSYLQSRWDAHAGAPSTAGGFGPMHLTDAVPRQSVDLAQQEDLRGDDARPRRAFPRTERPAPPRTLRLAAEITGISVDMLQRDANANIRGGAALLARYQREIGAPLSDDPRDWYGAVARYSGASDAASAARYADEVFALLAAGAERVTDDGARVTLTATALEPDRSWLVRLGLQDAPEAAQAECPPELGCAWVPAPYAQFGDGDYGNHDRGQRPLQQKLEYIVIHDTEGGYAGALSQVQDPTSVSWHYTLRSTDGQIAQHVRTADVAWHAGNWYVNAKSIGIEHEGFAAQGTWYTEALYRASSRLVRHLAELYDIPLDRAHILGHDNVPGILPDNVRGMHWDPGPYWDWSHYFELLGAPLAPAAALGADIITVHPEFASNQLALAGCQAASSCASLGSSAVILRTEPSPTAPLVADIGLHPDGSASTLHVSDHGARISTGQQYVVVERRGDWIAIWYLGQKAWFHSPAAGPSAAPARGTVASPKPGVASVAVYGRAYPESTAYPANVTVQAVVPLQYAWPAGQSYVVGATLTSEYYRTTTFAGSAPGDWTVIRGRDVYHQIQFGHRVMYVRASDVVLREVD